MIAYHPLASDTLHAFARNIITQVGQVVVGKERVTELALIALLCEGHILFEDVPGIGKTTLAKAMAHALGCTFARIQFTPDLLPSDITGISWFNQKAQEFEYRPGPLMAQVVLADEINRATPRTQAALLEAMQERQVTVDRTTHPLPAPFLVLATQNPIELEGTFPLPEAQIDRFLIRTTLGYPTEAEENAILRDHAVMQMPIGAQSAGLRISDPASKGIDQVGPDEIQAMQAAVRRVRVEDAVREYLVRVVRATRSHPAVNLGASPRGALALYQSAQALAALRGRDYVMPDDVQYMTPYVLTHRIHISPQTRLRGRTPAEIVADVVGEVPTPVFQ